MATTITTVTGTANPLRNASQCNIDRTTGFSPNNLWAAVIWASDSTCRFYQSANDGTSWAEDVSERLSGIDPASGVSMRIDRGHSGDLERELLWATYVTASDFKLRCRRARFGSNAGSMTWSFMTQSGGLSKHIATGSASIYHDLAVANGVDGVHFFYTGEATDNVYWRWMKHPSGSPWSFSLSSEVLVQGGNSFRSYPSADMRHTGNDADFLNGDVYVGWSTIDPEPTERQRLVRIPAKGIGSYDTIGPKRNMLADDVVVSGGSALNVARFDGEAMLMATVPHGDPATIVLHEMNPSDSARRTRNPPAWSWGNVTSLALSWDTASHDPYIIAAGTTDAFPRYTFYDRSADTWAPWVQINSDAVVAGTLNARPGSHGTKKIEFVYAISADAGANRAVRFEFLTIGNTPPTAPSWEMDGGYFDQTVATTLAFRHFDPNGDAQTAYKLRRQVNGGAFQFYTGSGWTGTDTAVSAGVDADGVSRVVLSAANNGADTEVISYTVATSDGIAFGPYSIALVMTGSTPIAPAITTPADASSLTAGKVTLSWTVAEQSAWEARILDSGNNQLFHNGRIADSVERGPEVIDYQLANSTTYKVALRTYNAEGIASVEDIHTFTTNWALPATPTYTASVDDAVGTIALGITNPGGGAAATVYNRVWRAVDADLDDPNDLTEYELVADQVPINSTWTDYTPASGVTYRYRVQAVSATFTTALGA